MFKSREQGSKPSMTCAVVKTNTSTISNVLSITWFIWEMTVTASLLTGAKHSVFTTNHLTDIDKTEHNNDHKQHIKQQYKITTVKCKNEANKTVPSSNRYGVPRAVKLTCYLRHYRINRNFKKTPINELMHIQKFYEVTAYYIELFWKWGQWHRATLKNIFPKVT